MVQPVGERPGFPSPPRGIPLAITGWAGDMVKVLTGLFTETNSRLNKVLPKDGTEDMTAPLTLMTYTDTPDTVPTASDYAGAVIYVSDGSSGQKFRGSDGSSWVNLG